MKVKKSLNDKYKKVLEGVGIFKFVAVLIATSFKSAIVERWIKVYHEQNKSKKTGAVNLGNGGPYKYWVY